MCPASDAAEAPRARMGERGSESHNWNALEALAMRLVLLIPSDRRCAIPILRPSYAADDFFWWLTPSPLWDIDAVWERPPHHWKTTTFVARCASRP